MSAASAAIAEAGNAVLRPAEFAAIVAIMQKDARIALPAGKATLVQSRLARRLRARGLSDFRDYLAFIKNDEEERAAMVVALTTNHTHFFRENHHFDHLKAIAIPAMQAAAQSRPVRIWSAGCSSGEEVYSIAMCLLGTNQTTAKWLRNVDVKLLATDLAPHVVTSTQRATYSEASVEPVPPDYRSNWIMPAVDSEVTMTAAARDLVVAKVLNLFDPWPMRGQFDVIFCRNVMIYFDEVAKAELEARFVESLRPGGYLYIGHSERLIGSAAHDMVSCGQTIYSKPGGPL